MSDRRHIEALARLVHAIDASDASDLRTDALFIECLAAAAEIVVGVSVWPRPSDARALPNAGDEAPLDLRLLAQEWSNDHAQCASARREREDLEALLVRVRRETVEACAKAIDDYEEALVTSEIEDGKTMAHAAMNCAALVRRSTPSVSKAPEGKDK